MNLAGLVLPSLSRGHGSRRSSGQEKDGLIGTLRSMESVDERQVRLLTFVRLSPGVTVSKLARLVRATPAATRRQVEALEAQGLLERRNHPDHPNANELHVTAAGIDVLSAEA